MSDFELNAAEFLALNDRVKHMSGWGPADWLGALNNISPMQLVAAASGKADSHIDALCHVIFDGTLYNGLSAGAVTATGATELSIEVAGGGIVGHGRVCEELNRWAFLCVIAPLRLRAATGSPVNPIAIF